MEWKRKDEFWFTPTGKLKVNSDMISTNNISGVMSDEKLQSYYFRDEERQM